MHTLFEPEPSSSDYRYDDHEAAGAASTLSSLAGAAVYPRSITSRNGAVMFLVRQEHGKALVLLTTAGVEVTLPGSNWRQVEFDGQTLRLAMAPTSPEAAAWLRGQLSWLQPTTLGLAKSAGCGDRLGLATPGHVRAVRACEHGIRPIYAQQSIREMTRTQRTPINVVDDAMWGVFQEGWLNGYGADADHLKTFEDINRCVAAGYTFYTFDPGAYVDNDSNPQKYDLLPWPELETTALETVARYKGRFDELTLKRAFVKYGRAVAQVTRLYRYLQSAMAGKPYEVEVSVDETDQPTSSAEHYIVASELHRLQVSWVSLAPRFVGRFEKGVDYIGDLSTFERDCAEHVRVMKELGPYKLSIHSGSDKFSIYPIVARLAGDFVHLKTAGTSYLEALRTIARCDLSLFKDVYTLAHERYAEDKASYHVSADPARAPRVDLAGISDPQMVLDQFDARQMLHVCFGSILGQYGPQIKQVLEQNEDSHYVDLERHFARHFQSFC